MRDRDMVAAIVAGDPAGLAAAYDCYAASLHAYCRTLLADPADAADAVQDTFVIAAAKLGGLRDPDRLRPWLYAVARNECHRRLRGRSRQADLEEAGEVIDDDADPGSEAQRGELRGLVLAAMAGLNSGDREVIELNLRHDLDGADLADALGVPASHAHALASRARAQLERALGALLVARYGRRDCAELDSLLADWDGELTVLLRKRVARHIESCQACGSRKRRELSPAALLSALPVVALPTGLRDQVLRLVGDLTPHAVSYCAMVTGRAEPFHDNGFPVQVSPVDSGGRGGRGPGRLRFLLAAAAALLLVAGAAGYLLLHGSWAHERLRPVAAASTMVVTVTPTSATPTATPTPTHSSASPSPSTSSPSPPTSPSPSPTTSSPSPSPSPTRKSPSPPPSPGTLSANPARIVLTMPVTGGPWSGTFTLTATGGPVTYTVDVPESGDNVPYFAAVPASGKLSSGQSVTIAVTAINGGPPGYFNTVTIEPGNVPVTVLYPPSG